MNGLERCKMVKMTVGLVGVSFTNSFWGFKREQFQQRTVEIKRFVISRVKESI